MNIRMEELPAPVARYLSYLLSIQNRSERTVYEYSLDLSAFLEYVFRKRQKLKEEEKPDLASLTDADIGTITTQEVYAYLLHTATDRANGSRARARKLSAIKGFFKFLYTKEKVISDNPAKDIESPKVPKTLPRFLSVEESRALLQASVDYGKENAKRDFCILTLFLNCGMRVSELEGISLSDLSEDLTRLVVTGKGNKQRMIYLNESCRAALAPYLEERGALRCKDPKALFVSRNHGRLTNKSVQALVYKYLKLAGLGDKNYSVHKLRHTAATLMYNTGKVDVRVLKDILGHEQLNTTQIYTHVSSDLMKSAMEVNPLNDAGIKKEEN